LSTAVIVVVSSKPTNTSTLQQQACNDPFYISLTPTEPADMPDDESLQWQKPDWVRLGGI
jgi:hypothetical protein